MVDSVTPSDQVLQQVRAIFAEQIPFNNFLGIKIERFDWEGASVRIDMRPELVGNFLHGILHGGVIASVLDFQGGLTAFLSLLKRMEEVPDAEKIARLSKFGTIDLRVDYLRPGKGKSFQAEATVLRTGNRVAVTRMELHNDEGVLIAVGTGTYVVV